MVSAHEEYRYKYDDILRLQTQMKISTALTLLYARCVLNALAAPTETSTSEAEAPRKQQLVPVEFDREYSQAELSLLAETHANSGSQHDILGTNLETTLSTMSAEVFKKNEDNDLNRRAANNLWTAKALDFSGSCKVLSSFSAGFMFGAHYDGHKVHFANLCPQCRLVDSFGHISVSGGLGKDIISDAQFRRRSCWFIPPSHMCTYEMFGTAQARVTALGKTPSITLSSFQPYDSKGAPFVLETCALTTDRTVCPPPTWQSPHCRLNRVTDHPLKWNGIV